MYQSRYNSIPLIGLRGIRTNQFKHTLPSMSNRTQSICSMLYYQCRTEHNLSVQCFTINVKPDTIYLFNALLSMSNRTQSICSMLYNQCQTDTLYLFDVSLSMSNRTQSICSMLYYQCQQITIYLFNALLSMSNRTLSICSMLYYQCQTGHYLSVTIPNLSLSFKILIENASCSLNEEHSLSLGNRSRVHSNRMYFGFYRLHIKFK